MNIAMHVTGYVISILLKAKEDTKHVIESCASWCWNSCAMLGLRMNNCI